MASPKLLLALLLLLSRQKKKNVVMPPQQQQPQPAPHPAPAPQPAPHPAPAPQPGTPHPSPPAPSDPHAPSTTTTTTTPGGDIATIPKSSGPLPAGYIPVSAVHAPSSEAAWMQSVSGQLNVWEWTQHSTGYIARREPVGGMSKMVLYGKPAPSGGKLRGAG
jgi:hypothetical protein